MFILCCRANSIAFFTPLDCHFHTPSLSICCFSIVYTYIVPDTSFIRSKFYCVAASRGFSSHLISFHSILCVLPCCLCVCVFLMLVLLLYSCCCVFSHSFRYNETASTTPSPLPLSEIMLQSNLHFVYFYRQHNSRILVYAKYFSRFDNCERIVNLPFIFSSSFGTPISLYFSFSYSFNSMARLLSLPFSDNTLILYIIAMPCFLVCSAYGVMIPLAIST